MNSKLYYKRGNRYVPFGVMYDQRYLTDGIWYVKSSGNEKINGSYIEGLFKIADKPVCKSFVEYCDAYDIAENIMNDEDFKAMLNSSKGICVADIVCKTLAIIKKQIEENKK